MVIAVHPDVDLMVIVVYYTACRSELNTISHFKGSAVELPNKRKLKTMSFKH